MLMRILAALLALVALPAYADYRVIRYGTPYVFEFTLRDASAYAFVSGVTLTAGDCKVSKGGAADANCATLPTAIASSNKYSFTVGATEAQTTRLAYTLNDATGITYFGREFVFDTCGDASARFTYCPWDASSGTGTASIAAGATWIVSGSTDQRVAFYTGATGLASGATVYRQRGTNAAAAMTTPDIVEDATVTGLYRLLVDEDTTITSGKTTEQMTFVITKGAVIVPVTVTLYDNLRVNVIMMNSSTVNGDGSTGNPWKH